MAAPIRAAVDDFRVRTDHSVDATSLESLVKGIVAQAGAKTNDEKAVAIYNWLHQAIFHCAYATEPAPQLVGPLKLLHAYGWGLCGGQHTVLKALFETAGWPCRYVGWSDPGHTTVEVNYDGRWHYFDVFLKCYFWSKDRSHIVSQEEIAADASLVLDAVKDGRAARSHLCCGDTPEGILSGVKSRKIVGDSKGWASVTWRDEGYSPRLRMPCGSALRLEWKAVENGFAVSGQAPKHSCGTKDFRNDPVLGPLLEHYGPRSWANGSFTYAPDFSQTADVADVELTNARASGGRLAAAGGKAAAVFRLPLPYPFVTAKIEAEFEGDGTLQISTDNGKSWQPCAVGDVSKLVRQKYDVCLRAEFSKALKSFRFESVVEHNRGVLPHLVTGTNKILADAKPAPGTAATVTFAWQEATVANPAKRQRWDGNGITYGEVKTLQRELKGGPLSAEVTVGGSTHPKMLYVERTVRSSTAR